MSTPSTPSHSKDICYDKDVPEAVNAIINDQQVNYLPEIREVEDLGLRNHITNPCLYYVQKNAALVEVQIGPSMALKITRSARITMLQQVANFGKRPKSKAPFVKLI